MIFGNPIEDRYDRYGESMTDYSYPAEWDEDGEIDLEFGSEIEEGKR